MSPGSPTYSPPDYSIDRFPGRKIILGFATKRKDLEKLVIFDDIAPRFDRRGTKIFANLPNPSRKSRCSIDVRFVSSAIEESELWEITKFADET